MRKIIAIFTFVIAISLLCGYVLDVKANTVGYPTQGTLSSSGGAWVFVFPFSVTVPDGFEAHLTYWSGYFVADDTGLYYQAAIYDSNFHIIDYGSSEKVGTGSWGWYNSEFDDTHLTNGTYYTAVYFTGNVTDYVLDAGLPAYNIASLTDILAGLNAWGTYALRSYGYFEIDTLNDRSDDYMILIFALFLVGLNVLLCFTRVPFLNFLFGVLSFGVASSFLAYSVPLPFWINLLVLLSATASFMVGFMRYRGN